MILQAYTKQINPYRFEVFIIIMNYVSAMSGIPPNT